MVERIKAHIAAGDEVVIFTARVAKNQYGQPEGFDSEPLIEATRQLIRDWTKEHIGAALEATAEKDYNLAIFYDDRAKQVVPGEGILVQEQLADLEDAHNTMWGNYFDLKARYENAQIEAERLKKENADLKKRLYGIRQPWDRLFGGRPTV
jgi:hypothetical protein